MRQPTRHELIAAVAVHRGDGKDLCELEFAPEAIDHRQQLLFVHPVDLIEQQIDRSLKSAYPFQCETIAWPKICRCVHDYREDVDSLYRLSDLVHHLSVEDAVRLVDARRIHQHNLRILPVHYSLNAIARRLWL